MKGALRHSGHYWWHRKVALGVEEACERALESEAIGDWKEAVRQWSQAWRSTLHGTLLTEELVHGHAQLDVFDEPRGCGTTGSP